MPDACGVEQEGIKKVFINFSALIIYTEGSAEVTPSKAKEVD